MIMKGIDMKNLNKKMAIAALVLSATASQALAEFKAVLSCGMNGSHINVLACFSDTELKLTNNGQTNIYKIYNIGNLGSEYRDGLHIKLSNSFSLKAQNSHDTLVLGLTIYDSSNKVVFQDMAGMWGVINVGN